MLVKTISLPFYSSSLLEKDKLVIATFGMRPIQAINILAVLVSTKLIEPFSLPTAITASSYAYVPKSIKQAEVS